MIQTSTTGVIASCAFENIPTRFTRRTQWVNRCFIERDGDLTKVPFSPGTMRRASTKDLTTWGTFDEAVEAYNSGRYDGIGFVFCSADPFVGIDLDNCRNPETGQIEAWAMKIIESFSDRYIEASPSGRGIHIITRGVQKEGVKTEHGEVYGQDRFFTMTGVIL